jgi:hypothetical protein
MDTRTFPATPQRLADLAAYLKGHGIALDPAQPTGEAKTGGWAIAADTVTVNVVKHPFAEEGVLWSKLEGLLKPT